MTDPVRWGFLGAGWIAHAAMGPAVHCADGAVLQAAAARDVERARSLSPKGSAYDSYDDLLDDDAVDAVYISLSNDAHLPQTLGALAAGKHVMCEKPLGLDVAQVRRMAKAATAAGRLLVEATWTRWHPRTQHAHAMVATGAIGEVRSVESGFTFPTVPANNYRLDPGKGGGALYDVGPYAVGAALWALGDGEVRAEHVDVRRHALGVDLTTSAQLRIGGATATAYTSVDEPEKQWLRIMGSTATLQLDPPAHTSYLQPSTLTVHRPDGDTVLEFPPIDPYRIMVENVSRAIRGDASAWVLPVTESERVAAALGTIREAVR